mmetsp:Transcript_49005/g.155198  ORF Transcript_49005/g.155198 Transcript_49005/m.155198 type:complete len:304 (-) Transcript_49005:190-1101(-)
MTREPQGSVYPASGARLAASSASISPSSSPLNGPHGTTGSRLAPACLADPASASAPASAAPAGTPSRGTERERAAAATSTLRRASYKPRRPSLRPRFFSDVRRFSSRRWRLPRSERPLRCRRTFGGLHASATRAASFSSASFRLAACVRWRSETARSSPPRVAPPSCSSRALTASGHGLCATQSRASHFVLSLLTACPPAPEERLYERTTHSSPSSVRAVGGEPSTCDGVHSRHAAGASPPCCTPRQLSEILPSATLVTRTRTRSPTARASSAASTRPPDGSICDTWRRPSRPGWPSREQNAP